jgi:hypothetical protein
LKQIRKRLTYANVMSSIAVFLVVGGATAFAAGHLGKNTVGTKQLKNNAVTTAKIKNGAVTGAKVNLTSLGTVPSATNAAHATSADNATNATNAKTLNGQSPSSFMASNAVRADGSNSTTPIDNFTSGSFTDIVSKTFTVPSAGFIYLTGSLTTEDDLTIVGNGFLLFRLTLDGNSVSGSNEGAHSISTSNENGVLSGSGSTTQVVPVSAGSHTVALQAKEVSGGDFIEGREVSALFVPNGS